jgi:pyridoxamine 5'-phosphate oxidase
VDGAGDAGAPGLDEAVVDDDPMRQFGRWYAEAEAAGSPEPDAMTLATASPAGVPSARTVLLRGFDERGFTFYTNYDSRKGQDLVGNPTAALVFRWAAVDRQVCVSGRARKVSRAESDAYFRSRPVGSRRGAWASAQSRVVESRAVLDRRLAEVTARFPGDDVPRPPFWGGFRVFPTVMEFWQSRPDRLHDRIRFRRVRGGWTIDRLWP